MSEEEARGISRRLRERLEGITDAKGRPGAWLAERIGCTPAHVSYMLSGKSARLGSVALWIKAARVLNESLDYLLLGRTQAADEVFTKLMRDVLSGRPGAQQQLASYLRGIAQR